MQLDFDSEKITIPCPKCGKEFTETIGWLKRQRQFTCVGCRTVVEVDTSQFEKGMAGAQKSVDKLDAVFRKLGKR